MYEIKSRRGKANLYTTSHNAYAVNLPIDVAKSVYKKARKRIHLNLDASRENQVKALQLVEKIQSLIDVEDWDGLFRFEESLKPKVVTGIFAKQSLQDLWEDYCKAKQEAWEVSYIENDIKQATRILTSLPAIYPDDVNPVINFLIETTTVKQTRRYLKQISACLNWCKKRRLIKENPLPDFIDTLATEKRNDEDEDINPFSIKERDLIIDAFKTGRFERFKGTHTQYADYIEFSFFTGARTSETLGLRWEHVDFRKRIIVFQESKVLATNGRKGQGVQKKGLKTQKRKIFPMSERLEKLLKERAENADLDQNVFEGISHHSFRGSVYRRILDCLEIDYRMPYQTRHTFISIMANHSDLKLHQIAKICGTSTNVIETRYLATNCDIAFMPEI